LPFLSAAPKLTLIAVLDILAVAFLIYQFVMMVRGRRAAPVLAGMILLGVVYLAASWLGLELLRSSLAALAPYTAFALIVMFQSEIRRVLARLGRGRWIGFRRQVQRRESAEEILLALGQLARHKTGGLIILERDIGLRTFIESGVLLDAMLSRDLLLSIFQPSGAMHDGAVIVQGDRIAAAACFLPLTMNPALSRQLGTRHRAAIGITEETDALALIVSEETGRISLAAGGEIDIDVPLDRIADRIARHSGGRAAQYGTDASVTTLPVADPKQVNRG
jgi:diadenylate cyclase